MIVRLGIVAPRRAHEVFEQAAETLPGMQPQWLLYDNEAGVQSIVAKTLDQCDALCFSGDMPHDRSTALLPPDLPFTVVRLTSIDVAICLLRARDRNLPIVPVSIDTADGLIVSELVEQLGLDRSQVAHLPHNRDLDLQEILAFHRDAHARLGTSLAITGRSNATQTLDEQLHIPVFAAVPVVSSIRAAMNRAVLAASNRHQADKGFAAALFRVVSTGDLVESEIRRLSLAKSLHDVVDLNDAWVEARSGGHDVLVFGHRRLMQTLTREWTSIPIAHELERQVGFPIAIGVGLGNSARRSVEFAEAALDRAVRDGGRCGYVVSEDGVVIGPMSAASEAPRRHRFRSEDIDVTSLAKELALSIPTITRLLGFERRLQGQAISASEMARELRLSPPSGRRIARKLDEHGLVTWAGVAQPAERGRPTKLFRLNMLPRIASSGTESASAIDDERNGRRADSAHVGAES